LELALIRNEWWNIGQSRAGKKSVVMAPGIRTMCASGQVVAASMHKQAESEVLLSIQDRRRKLSSRSKNMQNAYIENRKKEVQRPVHETWATSIKLLQVPHLPLLLPLLLSVFVELPFAELLGRVPSSLRKSMKLFRGNHSDVVEGPPFREEGVGAFLEQALRVVVVRCLFAPSR
jgi:hypothetical protein